MLGASLANAATSNDICGSIVHRDNNCNFSANTITANLIGNVTGTATTAINFTGTLGGDVTGTQANTVVTSVGGLSAINVMLGASLANSATSNAVCGSIVQRDANCNFSAGTIFANFVGTLTGNLIGNITSAIEFTGTLGGDVNGTQNATVVTSVGGLSAINVMLGASLANAATSNDVCGSIVQRDDNCNFSAGTITANLIGNITGTATTANNFTGTLCGDVTGTQLAQW